MTFSLTEAELARSYGKPVVYECSECGYVMFDAAVGDVDAHWRQEHSHEAWLTRKRAELEQAS